MDSARKKLLKQGILMDLLGMATMIIPFAGAFIDILWAPYAAKKMTEMYGGTSGKVAAAIVFIEELLPGLDFIPTFTLMWLYTFVWNKGANDTENMQPIRIKSDS